MESGSDDEFFDAPENLSFNRTKSLASETEESTKPNHIVREGNLHENEGNLKESEITTVSGSSHDNNESNDEEKTSAFHEFDASSQNKTPNEIDLNKNNTDILCAKGDEVSISCSVSKRQTESDHEVHTINDKTDEKTGRRNVDEHVFKPINIDSANKLITKKIEPIRPVPESPVGPTPVAPPRRKKKGAKKDGKQKELVVGNLFGDNNMLLPPSGGDSKATLTDSQEMKNAEEMDQVIEKGNSLNVVYNEDSMPRRSDEMESTQAFNETSDRPANLRMTSNSGRQLTDEEILEQVIIKNLDTGETIPLSMAEDNIPECTNPLSLHIFRIATEQDTDSNLPAVADQGDEDGHLSDVSTASGGKMQGKRKKLKKFLGKTVQKIKSVADEVSQQVRKGEEEESSEDDQDEGDDGYIKFKNHRANKDRLKFDHIKLLQDLSGEHIGAVWTMKFSLCGKLLATAGQDNIVRVWVLKDAAINFEEMRRKYSRPLGRASPTGSMTSSTSTASADDELQIDLVNNGDDDNTDGPFRAHPFVRYHGHTSDVLDLSWSKNYFLLSSSMDKTVRLWHISRQECLCCFQHVDFVTAICFHPRDDRYFLSGSLDGKIRLWNIPEKKVALWNEIDGYGTSLVTAANFCQNGKLAVVGTYDGRCIFFDTEKLKYHTQVTVRSSRGKNARGRKISGIEPMPGEDKVLITSNDSRIRLYDLKDHSLFCKYKGLQNESSQIRANFSHDGKLILCGSEDKYVYIWPTHHDVPNVRKDRNEYYESFSAHDAVVTAAIFAPFPTAIIEKPPQEKTTPTLSAAVSTKELSPKPFEIIVAADWQGGVKLYINR